jgi:ANTAR domain/PAS fold
VRVANDASPLGGESPVDVASTTGSPPRVGSFRFYFDDERWDWSPEVERMHGYQPGAAHPTTSLVLSHKHPDDYADIAATLEDIRRTRKPFSTRHRIIDLQGRTHEVVVVGELVRDDDTGRVIGTYGFYVDVTNSAQERETSITAALAKIVQGRALIEQVKGVLMTVYSIDADAAFDMLKWRSQETNVKIRQLAEQLMADFLALKYAETPPSRSTYDQILLTVHQRIAGA